MRELPLAGDFASANNGVRLNGRNVSKTVFFNVDTCDFNRNIVVDF